MMPIRMLPAIAYSIGCFLAAAFLTTLWVISRPVHVRDEMRSWRVLMALFVICFGGPYAYNEALTRYYGRDVEKAVKAAYTSVPIDGPMLYYKVTSVRGNNAKVLVVASEKQDWGGTDHPMVAFQLSRSSGTWQTTSYKILNSEKFDRETYVFPVYW